MELQPESYADVNDQRDQRDAKRLGDDLHEVILMTACNISLVSLAVSSTTLLVVREAIHCV